MCHTTKALEPRRIPPPVGEASESNITGNGQGSSTSGGQSTGSAIPQRKRSRDGNSTSDRYTRRQRAV